MAPPLRPHRRRHLAAAYSLQAYQALWNHLTAQVERRRRGEALQSVVLMPGTTLDAPRYASCEGKPLAVVFDLDESAEKAADPDAPWRRSACAVR